MGERDADNKKNQYYFEEWGENFSKRMDHWGKNYTDKSNNTREIFNFNKKKGAIVLGSLMLLLGIFILATDLGIISTSISPWSIATIFIGFYFILSASLIRRKK